MFPHSHHHLCEIHITVANSQIGGYLFFISEVPIVCVGFKEGEQSKLNFIAD